MGRGFGCNIFHASDYPLLRGNWRGSIRSCGAGHDLRSVSDRIARPRACLVLCCHPGRKRAWLCTRGVSRKFGNWEVGRQRFGRPAGGPARRRARPRRASPRSRGTGPRSPHQRASWETFCDPSGTIRATIAGLTTSREASSSTNARPARRGAGRRNRACPRRAGAAAPGRRTVPSVELHELRSATGTPARTAIAIRRPSSGRIRRHIEERPDSARRQHDDVGVEPDRQQSLVKAGDARATGPPRRRDR